MSQRSIGRGLKLHLMFFFGAGVSVPSKLPTALEATTKIRTLDPLLNNQEHVRILEVLSKLFKKNMRRQGIFRRGSGFSFSGPAFRSNEPNYEDLFSLCSEIGFWGEGRCDNIFTSSFMHSGLNRIKDELVGGSKYEKMQYLSDKCNLICDYIEETISDSLDKQYQYGFESLLELIKYKKAKNISIFSLNHDVLIEQFLQSEGIDYADGFGPPDGDVRWANEGTYKASRVRIFKLHGAINWFRFWKDGITKIGMADRGKIANIIDLNGRRVVPLRHQASFLTGREKAIMYHYGIYNDVFYHFARNLKDVDHVIMSGYGWGDFTINTFFEGWLDSSKSKSLVILHEQPDSLRDGSFTYWQSYNAWQASGQIKLIRKWLCNTSASEILATR
ncbi:MAG: SIR2 family protein [Phreatobacter sp.]|nr:SIR2 family protein [Phreatobacter sp.]